MASLLKSLDNDAETIVMSSEPLNVVPPACHLGAAGATTRPTGVGVRLNAASRRLSFRAGRRAGAALVVMAASSAVAFAPPVSGTSAGMDTKLGSASLVFTRTWADTMPGTAHRPIAGSSPIAARIGSAKVPVVLVGDRAGHLYARRLSSGRGGFSVQLNQAPSPIPVGIDATPSVSGSGASARIHVGAGWAKYPTIGGYFAFNSSGRQLWSVRPKALPGSSGTVGVVSGLAIGNVGGASDNVVSGSMSQMAYALEGRSGRVLPGFPWFEADSNFTTPALMDPAHSGHDLVVMGGDQTAGLALGQSYTQGGHIRILRDSGNAGIASRPGAGAVCDHRTNQVVQSSPAVGRFLANRAVGVVVGTGRHFLNKDGSFPSDTDQVIATDTSCRVKWQTHLGSSTSASPALADLDGTGQLDVIEGTHASATSGDVVALDGATGRVKWSRHINGGVFGGVVTADLLGTGHQEVVAATTSGVYILDHNGNLIGRLPTSIGVQSAALLTRDEDGKAGITIAGYNGRNESQIEHYQLQGNHTPRVDGPGSWPMFHHDSRLSGNAYSKP